MTIEARSQVRNRTIIECIDHKIIELGKTHVWDEPSEHKVCLYKKATRKLRRFPTTIEVHEQGRGGNVDGVHIGPQESITRIVKRGILFIGS